MVHARARLLGSAIALVVSLAAAPVVASPVVAAADVAASTSPYQYQGIMYPWYAGSALAGVAVSGGTQWVVSNGDGADTYSVSYRSEVRGAAFSVHQGLLITPSDVDLAPTAVLISDYANGRVVVVPLPYGSEENRVLPKVGGFERPSALATAADGRVYVADLARHSVSVFASDLSFQSEWSDEDELELPTGIDVAPDGTLYVSDNASRVVRHFTPGGRLLATFGQTGPSVARLGAATNVAVDAAGTVYVVDAAKHRVAVFSPDGAYLASLGATSTTAVEYLRAPAAVTFDEAGDVFVADSGRGGVLQFRPRVAALAKPAVSGAPVVGATLSASAGRWAATGTFTTYRWLRDGVPVSGATRATYPVRLADVGHRLAVEVGAQRPGVGSGSSTSAAVSVPRLRSTTSVATSASSVKAGGALTLAIAVAAPSGAVPVGKVTVKDGTKVVRTVTLAASAKGVGRTTLTFAARGTHRLTVTYTGGTQLLASSSSATVKVT